MLTTDFTGSYDHEKEEAEYAARTLLEDLHDGFNTPEQHAAAIVKELEHWKKCLTPEGFDDFSKHFHARLNQPL